MFGNFGFETFEFEKLEIRAILFNRHGHFFK